MDYKVAQYLIELNHQFYQTFSAEFSETRQRLQPGVDRILDQLDSQIRILDIGCGNGKLARALARKDIACSYVGTDFSSDLLAHARENLPDDFAAHFLELDLTEDDWGKSLPPPPFDTIFAFATLHHIPSQTLRLHTLREIRPHIKPDGVFYLSNWQFLNSPRLKKRVQPWEKVGLRERDVEEGDYLMDWRRGGYGLRYVHHFTPSELAALAEKSGYQVEGDFYSDGKEGNLGYYQVWKPS